MGLLGPNSQIAARERAQPEDRLAMMRNQLLADIAAPQAGAEMPGRNPELDSQVIRPGGVTLGDVRNMSFMDLIAKEHGPMPGMQAPPPQMPPMAAPQLPPAPQAPPPQMGPPPSAPMIPQPAPAPAPQQDTAQVIQNMLQSLQPPPLAQTPTPQSPAIQAAPAVANINNDVTMPQPTFTPAAPRPQLPSFLDMNLAPSTGYSPPPQIPGYAMPRTGSPFRAPQAPQLQAPQPLGAPMLAGGQSNALGDLDSLYARYGLLNNFR